MTDGEKLRELRKEKGYTQKALAISLGVSQMSISIAENKDYRAQEFLIALEGLEGFEPMKSEYQKRSHRPLDISLDNRVSTRYWLENGELKCDRTDNPWKIKKPGKFVCRKKSCGNCEYAYVHRQIYDSQDPDGFETILKCRKGYR